MCLKLVYLTVVQIFYCNMTYVIGGPISTIVRGVSIGLDGDAICHILDLPSLGQRIFRLKGGLV